MKVPRKYLGNEGNNLLNSLASQASAKGIPVNLGEVVNLNIKMAGKINDPAIKTELKEVAGDAVKDMQQQAVDFAKAKADTVKQTVKDTLTAVKKQVLSDLKDEAKNKLFGNKDSVKTTGLDDTKKKTESTIKNTFNNLLKRGKKQTDTTAAKQ